MIVLTFYAAILAILLARHALFLRCECTLISTEMLPVVKPAWSRATRNSVLQVALTVTIHRPSLLSKP